METSNALNKKKNWSKPVIEDLEIKLTKSSKTVEGLEFEKNGFGGNAGDDRHPS